MVTGLLYNAFAKTKLEERLVHSPCRRSGTDLLKSASHSLPSFILHLIFYVSESVFILAEIPHKLRFAQGTETVREVD